MCRLALRSLVLALILFVPVPVLAQSSGFCAGCSERTPDNEDLEGECHALENLAQGGWTLKCEIHFKLVIGNDATNCSQQPASCSQARCWMTWRLEVKALSFNGGPCTGVVFSFDESLDGDGWKDLSPDAFDAGSFLGGGYYNAWPPLDENPAVLSTRCGTTVSYELMMDVSGFPSGQWDSTCPDNSIETGLECSECHSPSEPGS